MGDVVINNYANITAAAGDGIRAGTFGVGSVTVIDGTWNGGGQGTTIDAHLGQYGIDAFNNFAGDIFVSTAAGDTINSGGSGILAVNNATTIAQSANNTIVVQAYGVINSGATPNISGSRPAGILASYSGDPAGGGTPNANVFWRRSR